jgi:hypothetical protein
MCVGMYYVLWSHLPGLMLSLWLSTHHSSIMTKSMTGTNKGPVRLMHEIFPNKILRCFKIFGRCYFNLFDWQLKSISRYCPLMYDISHITLLVMYRKIFAIVLLNDDAVLDKKIRRIFSAKFKYHQIAITLLQRIPDLWIFARSQDNVAIQIETHSDSDVVNRARPMTTLLSKNRAVTLRYF